MKGLENNILLCMYLKMRLNILKTDETKIGRGRSEGHTTALAWTGTWWYDATSDLSFLNYSNLLLCKLNGGIDSEWRNLSCPLSFVPFCALLIFFLLSVKDFPVICFYPVTCMSIAKGFPFYPVISLFMEKDFPLNETNL